MEERRMKALGLPYDPHTRPIIEYQVVPGLRTEPIEEPTKEPSKKPAKSPDKKPAKKTTNKPTEGPKEGRSQTKETDRESAYDVDEWGRWRE